jgi:hypothetical protein
MKFWMVLLYFLIETGGKKMTDRFHSLTVVLEQDMRDDDAQAIINAISQMRNVLSVNGNVADLESHVAYSRARQELGGKLFAILYPKS